jgi:hypothetical protein
MNSITMANLRAVVARINRTAGTPEAEYTKGEDGICRANVGNYHLDGAYGGYKLCQMVNDGGGVRDVTSGYVSKRELYNLMQAFLSGIESARS